jgi:hypothetical protein
MDLLTRIIMKVCGEAAQMGMDTRRAIARFQGAHVAKIAKKQAS